MELKLIKWDYYSKFVKVRWYFVIRSGKKYVFCNKTEGGVDGSEKLILYKAIAEFVILAFEKINGAG